MKLTSKILLTSSAVFYMLAASVLAMEDEEDLNRGAISAFISATHDPEEIAFTRRLFSSNTPPPQPRMEDEEGLNASGVHNSQDVSSTRRLFSVDLLRSRSRSIPTPPQLRAGMARVDPSLPLHFSTATALAATGNVLGSQDNVNDPLISTVAHANGVNQVIVESLGENCLSKINKHLAYDCAQQLEDMARTYLAFAKDTFTYLANLAVLQQNIINPGLNINALTSTELETMLDLDSIGGLLSSEIILAQEVRKVAIKVRCSKNLYALPESFQHFLMTRTVTLCGSWQEIQARLNMFFNRSHGTEKRNLYTQLRARQILNSFEFLHLALKTMWKFLNPETLSLHTQRLLRSSPILTRFLRGETEEHPLPHLCLEDVQAHQNEYSRTISTLSASAVADSRGPIPITRPTNPSATVTPATSSPASRKTGSRRRLPPSLPFNLPPPDAGAGTGAGAGAGAGGAATSVDTVATTSTPASSSASQSVAREVEQDIPSFRIKVKTRGPSQLPREASEPQKKILFPFIPVEDLLPEEFARFWWDMNTRGIPKTFPTFKTQFARIGGEINEGTGSSHCKLLYTNPQGVLIKGGIWKYHRGMDRFGAHSMDDLLRYMERINRIPWRNCSEDLENALGILRYQNKGLIREILSFLHCKLTLSADNVGQIL